ncbi:MAG: hypothetical protein HY403_01785 [Elusimicrobia bacterium]|nr:hypothetical protein [Elusimicrobiota bacterium]
MLLSLSLLWRRREREPEPMGGLGGAVAQGIPTTAPDPPEPIARETWANAAIGEQRAEQLLRAALSETQARDLAERGYFEIVGSLGHRYRIRRAPQRNVDQLDEAGGMVRSLCAAPLDVPVADAMLAQKLLIEADELAFAFLANTYVVSLPRRADVGLPGEAPEASAESRGICLPGRWRIDDLPGEASQTTGENLASPAPSRLG